MNVNNTSTLINEILYKIDQSLADMPMDNICNFKNKLIGAIFYGNCHGIVDNEIKNNSMFLLNCKIKPEELDSVNKAIQKLRTHIYNISLQKDIPTKFESLRARLKGQEKLHFKGQKCTELGYYDDDHLGKRVCILDTFQKDLENGNSLAAQPFRSLSQEQGYQEMSFNSLGTQTLYTLQLGPCIAILMVGIKKDGTAKASLMHEDYSSPKNSVTDIFNLSFQSEIQSFEKLKIFLIGGNGGEKHTRNRFSIHRSEIDTLQEKYGDLINLSISTDNLRSPSKEFEFDESNVFFTMSESSYYLWILQNSQLKCSVEHICVNGPELSVDKLASCYQERILPLLNQSQTLYASKIPSE